MLLFSNKINSGLLAYKFKNSKIIKLANGVYSDDVATPIELQITEKHVDILNYLGIKGAYANGSGCINPIVNQTIYLEGECESQLKLEGGISVVVKKTQLDLNHRYQIFETGLYRPNIYRLALENLSTKKINQKKSNIRQVEKLLFEHFLTIAKSNPAGLNEDLYIFKSLADKIQLKDSMQAIVEIFKKIPENQLGINQNIDQQRMAMFLNLKNCLNDYPFNLSTAKNNPFQQNKEYLYFLESYFSNYIEGTEFEIEEAIKIVFEKGYHEKIQRNQDGYDITSLYKLIIESKSDKKEIDLSLLKDWHKQLMSHRFTNAGDVKTLPNKAGTTRFVSPLLVENTLTKAIELGKDITNPVARAAYLKLIFLECHPFDDGNGRLSRLILNSELSKSGFNRLIVPTVFRDDYLLALKSFSKNNDPIPYSRMINKLLLINHDIHIELGKRKLEDMIEWLTIKSAFENSTDSVWGIQPIKEEKSFNFI